MVRLKDIEAINARTAEEIAHGQARSGNYYGFIEIDFLPAPPFVMLHAGDCGVCDIVLNTGEFERASLRIWCELGRKATGIMDIGAYTGIYALAAAALRPDLTVHAFEPNPFSMARVRTNRLTNYFHNIQEHPYGVGTQNAQARLSWHKKHLPYLNSAATFRDVDEAHVARFESTIAQIRRIDEPDFCASLGQKVLIKVDVEGAEVIVMKGLARLLPQRPDFILETFDSQACEAIGALLAPYGYRFYFIDEKRQRLRRQEKLSPCDPGGDGMNQFLTAGDELPLPDDR